MTCCMGPGAGSLVFGGVQLADWALGLTFMLMAVLFVIGGAAIIRVVAYALQLIAKPGGRSAERRG